MASTIKVSKTAKKRGQEGEIGNVDNNNNSPEETCPTSPLAETSTPDSTKRPKPNPINKRKNPQPPKEIVICEEQGGNSWVWLYFQKEIHDGIHKAVCQVEEVEEQSCQRAFINGNSTGNLITHLATNHSITQNQPYSKNPKVYNFFVNN